VTHDDVSNNVLIIDDSAAARATIAGHLRRAGYGVFELSSAIGATRTIMQNRIGVAIVDLSMPGLPGDKLVALLRENDRLSALKIIVVSGQGDEELRRISNECAVDAVLSKSEIGVRLLPLVDACFRRAPRTPSRAATLDFGEEREGADVSGAWSGGGSRWK